MAKKKKILLVDEEVDILEPLAFNLETCGYEVVTAESGNNAFELFRKKEFDAIITDIKMPDGNGIELLKNIKLNKPLCPVVSFITGYSDLTLRQAFHLGASSTFSKPFDFDELRNKIEWALASPTEKWSQSNQKGNIVEIENSDPRTIGSGGVSLHIDGDDYSQLAVNDRLGFEFNSELGVISGQGWVRWMDEKTGFMGVEFAYLDPDSLAKISKYLQDKKPVPYIPEN